jgi:hypothetical protein
VDLAQAVEGVVLKPQRAVEDQVAIAVVDIVHRDRRAAVYSDLRDLVAGVDRVRRLLIAVANIWALPAPERDVIATARAAAGDKRLMRSADG